MNTHAVVHFAKLFGRHLSFSSVLFSSLDRFHGFLRSINTNSYVNLFLSNRARRILENPRNIVFAGGSENNNTSYVISLEKARNTTHTTLFYRENNCSNKKFPRFNFLKKREYGTIFSIISSGCSGNSLFYLKFSSYLKSKEVITYCL